MLEKKLNFGWIVSLALCNLSRLVLPLLPNFYLRERECVCMFVCERKRDRGGRERLNMCEIVKRCVCMRKRERLKMCKSEKSERGRKKDRLTWEG